MLLPTSTYIERKIIGNIAEDRVLRLLKAYNIPAKLTGSERWLSDWLIKAISIPGKRGYEVLRHFPDIDTGRALIQVKAGLNSTVYPTLPIEIDSYNVCKKLAKDGVPVLIVWMLSDRSLVGEWVDNLIVIEPKTEPDRSHTPFYLISKYNLKPISKFIRDLR